MSTGRAPDFHQWLTRIHGFKVGTSRNSYTVADLRAAWYAAERAWMEVANKNAQERNAAVDREVVLLEALKRLTAKLNLIHNNELYRSIFQLAMLHGMTYDGPNYEAELAEAEAAIKQAERTCH